MWWVEALSSLSSAAGPACLRCGPPPPQAVRPPRCGEQQEVDRGACLHPLVRLSMRSVVTGTRTRLHRGEWSW